MNRSEINERKFIKKKREMNPISKLGTSPNEIELISLTKPNIMAGSGKILNNLYSDLRRSLDRNAKARIK